MLDYFTREIERQSIYGNKDYTYGIVLLNPFAKSRIDMNYRIIEVNKNTYNPEGNLEWTSMFNAPMDVTTHVAICKNDVVDGGTHRTPFFELRDGKTLSFNFTENDYRIIKLVVPEDEERTYTIDFRAACENNFVKATTVKKKHVKIDINRPNFDSDLEMQFKAGDEIEIIKSISADDIVAFSEEEQSKMIMTILFLNGYDLPVVRVYKDDTPDKLNYCVNSVGLPYPNDDAIIDLTECELTMNQQVNILTKPFKVAQERSYDNIAKFDFINQIYLNHAKLNETLRIEDVYTDDNMNTTRYKNIVTGLEYNVEDDEHYTVSYTSIQYYLNDIFGFLLALKNHTVPEVNQFVTIRNKDATTSIEYVTDKNRTEFYSSESAKRVINVLQHIILDPAYNPRNPADKTGKLYKAFLYVDISNIAFNILYDSNTDIYSYQDAVETVHFYYDGFNIKPMYATMANNIKPDYIYIRDEFGVPHFFKNPMV